MSISRRSFLTQSAALTGGATTLAGIVGCGAPGSGPAESTGPSAQPVTIRWVNDVGTATADAFNEEFNKRFNAKYGNKIVAQVEAFPDPNWGKRFEKWVTMAVSGTMPEIVWLCCTYIRPFMMKGLVAELDKYIKRDLKQSEINDFYKGPWEAFSVDGKQMGIPVYLNTNMMFVNKNHLKESGLAYPSENWTRQQFLDFATKLYKKNERWGFDMPFASVDRNISWIWSNGGEPHDPKDMPVVTKLTYDAPKTVEALEFLHGIIWKSQISPTNDDQRGGMNRDNAFLNGKTAILFAATGNAGDISVKAPESGLDWDFLPLVKGPSGHGARVSTDGYMIDKATKYGDQTWTVLRELVSTESAVLRAQQARRQPPRKSAAAAWEKVYDGKNAKLGRIMADTARPDPRAFWKEANEVGKIVGGYMNATLLKNEMPVKQAMSKAMEEVRGFYASVQ